MALETYSGSRFGATMELMDRDLREGIEGKDWFGDLMVRTPRNIATAVWHGIQGIIPSIANAGNDQEFTVVRRDSPFHGTVNSVTKVFQTKGIIGKASAAIVELTDGPIDDALNIVGSGQWIIVPKTRANAYKTLSKPELRLAA